MMKKLIILVIALGLFLIGCDSGNGGNGNGSNENGNGNIIPEKWQGTFYYGNDSRQFVTILPSGVLIWSELPFSSIPSGSSTGVKIVNGGTVTAPGVTGEWVYLAINGVNRGIILDFSPEIGGFTNILSMGFGGVSDILSSIPTYGASLSPVPNISNMPGWPTGNEWINIMSTINR